MLICINGGLIGLHEYGEFGSQLCNYLFFFSIKHQAEQRQSKCSPTSLLTISGVGQLKCFLMVNSQLLIAQCCQNTSLCLGGLPSAYFTLLLTVDELWYRVVGVGTVHADGLVQSSKSYWSRNKTYMATNNTFLNICSDQITIR